MQRVLPITLLLLTLTGCGTVANFQRESFTDATPYGGVQIAAEQFKPAPRIAGSPPTNCGVPPVLGWPFFAADVVGSAVADTLTLPITVPLVIARGLDVPYVGLESSPDRQNPGRRFWLTDLTECGIPAAPAAK
jgi:hypothetical protein